jgi:uncharacterized protein (DUF1778 family)
MTITIRVNDDDRRLIGDYAKLQNKTISEIVREATLEKIEDAIDIQSYLEAMEEHRRNPQVCSFAEVWQLINGS